MKDLLRGLAPGGSRPRALVREIAIAVGVLALAASTATAYVPDGYTYDEAYITSADGTKLHADRLTPADLAPGERRPVLMVLSPYAAQGDLTGYGDGPTSERPAYKWVQHAAKFGAYENRYIAVIVDVRGFGGSEGCWDAGGAAEQADIKTAVEWAADQPRSTGKVAVEGLSYDGWTGVMALATNPRGLAAVVAESPVVDFYSLLYPGGVPDNVQLFLQPRYTDDSALQPPGAFSSSEYFENWVSHGRPECRSAHFADIDNPDPSTSFWRERNLLERAAQSTVPVYGTQGFLDFNVPPNQLPELYPRLANGRGLYFAQYVHDNPIDSGEPIGRPDAAQVEAFLQQALSGEGPGITDPPVVVQEAPTLRWRAEDRWPPADAQPFSMAVKQGTYTDESGNASGDNIVGLIPPVSGGEQAPTGQGTWTFSAPLSHQAHLSGRATLDVQVAGPAEARVVALLYDVSADNKAYLIARGASLAGDGQVKATLYPQDWRLAPDHRIGLLISGADDTFYAAHEGTGAEVQVESGRISLPLLRYARDTFIAGGKSAQWAQVKRQIDIDEQTIEARTVHGDLPPEQQARPASKPRLRLRIRPRRTRIGRRTVFRVRVTTRGRPVRGAVVRLADKRSRTNRHGRGRIVKRFRRASVYRARARRKGYRRAVVRVRVAR